MEVRNVVKMAGKGIVGKQAEVGARESQKGVKMAGKDIVSKQARVSYMEDRNMVAGRHRY